MTNDLKATIKVPVADTSKALAALTASGIIASEPYKVRDSQKALLALRASGLPAERAEELLDIESILADDFDIRQNSITEELIELFGEEHVEDALSYAYHYMNRFELSWSDYKKELLYLLETHKASDLIVEPHIVRSHLLEKEISSEARMKKASQ